VSELVDIIDEARRTGDCARLTDAVPYCRFAGISAELCAGELRGKLSFSPEIVGNSALPALHGGTLGALLESTAIFKLLCSAEAIVLPKTITITIAFLRSAKPIDTFAEATITRHGRRVANVRTVAWQDDRERPVAVADGHFLIG
jgi:acyl-coenzyme A thioesterase PaaI-like protein